MIRFLKIAGIFWLCILPLFSFAQKRTVTGVVSDPDELPLIAANITLVETGEEFFTNYKGSFHISVTEGQTLRFSYAGYQTKDIKITDQEVINVVMSEEILLDEKIRTAYAISQNQRSPGYATDVILSGDLALMQDHLLTERIQGRSNGFQVITQGGGPGQSALLHFRGSLPLGSAIHRQPLIIVDGLPLDNAFYTAGDAHQRSLTHRLDDLRPGDIETMTVLRGGEATALYGIHGADGAMILTTKKGGEGLNIRFSSSFGLENLYNPPSVQKRYSQGYMGVYDADSPWPGWGAPVAQARKENPSHPARLFNNYKNAYRNGQLWGNTLALSGGDPDAGFRISLAHQNHQGILPHSGFQDLSGGITGFIRPAVRLKLNGGFQYNRSGGNRADAIRFNKELTAWSPAADVNDSRFPDGTMKGDQKQGREGQNPVYGTETNRFADQVDHYRGYLGAEYEATEWMSILYRAGLDQYSDFRVSGAEGPRGIEGENHYLPNGNGFAGETTIKNQLLNSHLILHFQRELTGRIYSEFLAGAEINHKKYDRHTIRGNLLSQWDKPDLEHVHPDSLTTSSYHLPHKTSALFSELKLHYDRTIYLTFSHRTDKSSTLPGKSYFQSPSAGVSYIFTEHFQPLMGLLDLGKIRASFASLSRDPYPYMPGKIYRPDEFGSFFPQNLQVDDQLRSEKTKTFETGIDLEAMGGKAGLRFSYFHILDEDIILPVMASGPSAEVITNAASIRQKGIEVSLDLHPLQAKNLQWDIGIQFSSQRNRIISTAEEHPEILLIRENGYGGSYASILMKEGGSFGDIYGTSYRRFQPQDNIRPDKNAPLLIGEDGFPVRNDDPRLLGNIFPDWTGALSTRFLFRNIEIAALLDTWQGLQRYNSLDHAMAWNGVASYTKDRDEMVVFKGVRPNGESNTLPVYKGQGEGPDGKDYGEGFYQKTYSGVTENFVQNANWIRLRNLKFSYRFPEKWMGKIPLSDIRLTASGNNLWISSPYKGINPATGWSQTGADEDPFHSYGYPSVRRYMITLDILF